MTIINQDQDRLITYTGEEQIYYIPWIIGKIFYGYNLFCGFWLLGTFESMKEVEQEIRAILSCAQEWYVVSGGVDWLSEIYE